MKRSLTREKFSIGQSFSQYQTASVKSHKLLGRYRGLLLLMMLAFLGLSGFVGYRWYNTQLQRNYVNQYLSRLTPLLFNMGKPMPSSLPKIASPQLAKNIPTQQVRFEFYDSLPAMKVANNDEASHVSSSQSSKALSQQVTAELNRQQKEKNFAQDASHRPIVSAEDLEKDFARHLKAQIVHKNYIVQLGMYQQYQAALKYRNTLSQSGLIATVVKVKNGTKPAYRIQLGPYMNINHAKLAQKKLQQKGIVSLVRQV